MGILPMRAERLLKPNKSFNRNWNPYMWRLFFKDLFRLRKRFFLTALAIAWGTISLVLFLAFGEGIKQSFLLGQKGLGQDIIMPMGGATGKPFKGLATGRPIRLTVDDVHLLRQQIPQIAAISPEYQRWDISITAGRNTVNCQIAAVDPAFGDMRSHFPMVGGRFINATDIRERRRVIFLGDQLEQRLFGHVAHTSMFDAIFQNRTYNGERSDAVGKTVMLNGKPFLVVGVMQKKMQMGMYNGPDAAHAVIPATTYLSLYGERYLNRIIMRPERIEDSPFIVQRTREILGAKHRFDPTDKRALPIWNVVENQNQMSMVFLALQAFLGLVGGMTLLIAGAGLLGEQLDAVDHRARRPDQIVAQACAKQGRKSQIIHCGTPDRGSGRIGAARAWPLHRP